MREKQDKRPFQEANNSEERDKKRLRESDATEQEQSVEISQDKAPSKGTKRPFVEAPNSEQGDKKRLQSVPHAPQNPQHAVPSDDLKFDALIRMSPADLSACFERSFSYCSIVSYKNLIDALRYRLDQDANHSGFLNLIPVAFNLFERHASLWANPALVQRNDKLTQDKLADVPYSLGLLSNSIRNGIKVILSHEAMCSFLSYIAQQVDEPKALSFCLQGINCLAKNRILPQPLNSHTIERLVYKLSLGERGNSASTTMNITASFQALHYLRVHRGWNGNLPAELINTLLATLLTQDDIPFIRISDTILALGRINLERGITGLLSTEKLLALCNKKLDVGAFQPKNVIQLCKGLEALVRTNALGVTPLVLDLAPCVRVLCLRHMSAEELNSMIEGLATLRAPIRLNEESIVLLMTSLLHKPISSDAQFASILAHFVAFKEHAKHLDPLFARALEQLTFSCNDVSPRIKDEVLRAMIALRGTSWPSALEKKFNISMPAPSPAARFFTFDSPASLGSRSLYSPAASSMASASNPPTPKPLQSSVSTPGSLSLTSPALKQIPRKLPLASVKPLEIPSARQFFSPKGGAAGVSLFSAKSSPGSATGSLVQLKTEKTQEAWLKACRNKLFLAISKCDLLSLEDLLGPITTVERSVSKQTAFSKPSAAAATSLRSPRPSQVSRQPMNAIQQILDLRKELKSSGAKQGIIDALMKEFLKTEAEPLRRLISQSKAIYFDKLLHASSKGLRFELAQSGLLDPILLHLPLAELKLFINGLVKPHGVGIHADSGGLLTLVKTLNQRAEQSDVTKKIDIIKLQLQLLEAAIVTHNGHTNVSVDLQSALERVQHERTRAQQAKDAPVPPKTPGSARSTISQPLSASSASAHVPRAPAVPVNRDYLYESEDIQTILKARLKSVPSANATVLASVLMDDEAENNRAGDVLKSFLAANPMLLINNQKSTLIIPIEKGNHWVGLKITVTGLTIDSITYYNSLQNRGDKEFMEVIRAELLSLDLISADLAIKPAADCIQQPDLTSCGAYLIENIYCDLKGSNWKEPNALKLCEIIRRRHLDLLKADPEARAFHADFNRRQAGNIATVQRTEAKSPATATSAASTNLSFFSSEPVPMDIDSDKPVLGAKL